MKQQFNPEEYAKLKHRIEALRSRVKLDHGPEQETAKRLLAKLKKKLEEYEKTHEIPEQMEQDYSTTINGDFTDFSNWTVKKSTPENAWNPNPNFKRHVHFEDDNNYHEDTRSEEQMINDLGVLYAIFGSTYQTTMNYHIFKIRFKKQIENNGAFYRVIADIYEDDIRICKDIIIGFWPFRSGDDKCGDMQFASMKNDAVKKYDHGAFYLYHQLLEELKDIWNYYFDAQNAAPMLAGPTVNFIEDSKRKSENDKLKVQLTKEQRKAVIEQVERDIASGNMKYFKYMVHELVIDAYKPYENLNEFLEESGVIYKVEESGVYILDIFKKEFGQLVDIKYKKSMQGYKLCLI